MTGAPPKIELLVVQPTPFCNIDCRYCYLPDRNSKAVISEATLVNLFTQLFASGWARDEFNVVWHWRADGFADRLLPVGVRARRTPETCRHAREQCFPDQWDADHRRMV